jgi:magnesium chelatase family protein
MNPCPCGNLLGMGGNKALSPARSVNGANFVGNGSHGDAHAVAETPACTCTAAQVRRYLAKVSGPLMDTIAITMETASLSEGELENALPGEDSATVRKRVMAARARPRRRGPKLNSQLRGKELREACRMNEATRKSVEEAKEQFSFSAVRVDLLCGVARSIADLVVSDVVEQWHFQESLNYRPLASKLFA